MKKIYCGVAWCESNRNGECINNAIMVHPSGDNVAICLSYYTKMTKGDIKCNIEVPKPDEKLGREEVTFDDEE